MVLPVALAAATACAGKTQGGVSSPEPGAGNDDAGVLGGGGGMTASAGAPASAGSAGERHGLDPPIARPPGANGGAAGDSSGGDHLLPPDALADQNAELQKAHDASPTCVRACKVLDPVCGDSGFNHCDLSCPGRLAGDATCRALVENAYACLADNVDRAVICPGEADPQVRCGVCDGALSALAQSCGSKLECSF